MKSITSVLLSGLFLITIDCAAKKEKLEKQQQQTDAPNLDNSLEEYDEPHVYRPNPVILDGVGQIMNGALSIAQNPHSRPNIGHSVAAMIYGIMKIIVEKVAHKKMHPDHLKILEECCDEISADMSKEITEIIIAKSFTLSENESC